MSSLWKRKREEKDSGASDAYGLLPVSEPSDSTLDVVLVHGLTGNQTTTWTYKDTKVFWPDEFLKNDLPQARIFTFGYDADVVRLLGPTSTNTLRDHGHALCMAIARKRYLDGTALLISRGASEPYIQDVLNATRAIAFMGTPHAGSDLAKWGAILTNLSSLLKTTAVEIVNVLKPGSEVLANLQQEFHTMLDSRERVGKPSLDIFCFFEELPCRGIGTIVGKPSAILPRYQNQGIHSDHIGMTKFAKRTDSGYQALLQCLLVWQKQLRDAATRQSSKGRLLFRSKTALFNDRQGHQLEISSRSHAFDVRLHEERLEDLCNFSWRMSQECDVHGRVWCSLAAPLSSLHIDFKKAKDYVCTGLLESTMHDQVLNITDCAYGTLFDLEQQMREYRNMSDPMRKEFDSHMIQNADLRRWDAVLSAHDNALALLNAGFMRQQEFLLRKKFDQYTRDVRTNSGSVASEVLTYITADNGESDAVWKLLTDDLRRLGVSDQYLTLKRPLLVEWFKTALQNGELTEQSPRTQAGAGVEAHTSEKYTGSDEDGRIPPRSNDSVRNAAVAIAQDDQMAMSTLLDEANADELHRIGAIYPLQQATVKGSVQVLQSLLQRGYPVDALDGDSCTSLRRALYHGKHSAARILIEHDADVKARYGMSERTLLHLAASLGDEDFVSILLEAGADPSVQDNGGCTPLHIAVWKGQLSIARQLCEASASVWCEDFTGDTPLDLVRRSPIGCETREAIIGLLIDYVPGNAVLLADPELRSDAVQFLLMESIFDAASEENVFRTKLEGGDLKKLMPKQFPMNSLAEELFDAIF